MGSGGERFALPPMRPRQRDNKPYIKETWTQKFCLLDSTDASHTPTTAMQVDLNAAGLGAEKIIFPNKNGDHAAVLNQLEMTYPHLKSQNGAFELLRSEGGGSSRKLLLIPPRHDGYPIQYLKKSTSANTTIYIRPVQSDITMYGDGVIESLVGVTCVHCSERYPFNEIRNHQLSCFEPAEVELVEPSSASGSANSSSFASNSGDTTTQEEILKNMFPNVPQEEIKDVVMKTFSIDEAANALSDRAVDVETNLTGKFSSLKELVLVLCSKKNDETSIELEVDRNNLWMDSIRFYKKKIDHHEFMLREFYVSFKGEDGVDGGAMKQEFFTLLLKEIQSRLFEGLENHRLLVKDISKSMLFVVAGTVFVHSLIEGCPNGLPIFAEPLYYAMCKSDQNVVMASLSRDIVPVDASTQMLLELIEKLEKCGNGNDVNILLYDDDSHKVDLYWSLINAAHWPKTEKVTIDKVNLLVSQLLYNEVVLSRHNEIDMFSMGLKTV